MTETRTRPDTTSDADGERPPPKSIGVASRRPDGTIVLQLRAEGPNGLMGEGLLTYPPSHPQHASVLEHLGGLEVGETKSVPPWPTR
ncbi:MAG: hypothetical protein WKG00_24140 [Polyangiaceae bacterium]